MHPLYPTLPGFTSPNSIFFTTIRLQNALPEHFEQNLGLQFYSQQLACARFPDSKNLLHQARKRLFSRFDQALDLGKYGPAYLQVPALEMIVQQEVYRLHDQDYQILSYSILPNHVHMLVQFPDAVPASPALDEFDRIEFRPLRDFVTRIQEATELPLISALRDSGQQADTRTFQKQNTKGELRAEGRFWHPRSFDFQVLEQAEIGRITAYILQNAAKAADL